MDSELWVDRRTVRLNQQKHTVCESGPEMAARKVLVLLDYDDTLLPSTWVIEETEKEVNSNRLERTRTEFRSASEGTTVQ